jgi:hypothetical protein
MECVEEKYNVIILNAFLRMMSLKVILFPVVLACGVMYSDSQLQTFQKNLLAPHAGQKMEAAGSEMFVAIYSVSHYKRQPQLWKPQISCWNLLFVICKQLEI